MLPAPTILVFTYLCQTFNKSVTNDAPVQISNRQITITLEYQFVKQDYLTMGYRLDIPQDAIGDHFGIGKRSIISGENEELDVQQDWMLLNSSEENGITMLRFNRKLNTTDQEKDVVIQVNNEISIYNMAFRLYFFYFFDVKIKFYMMKRCLRNRNQTLVKALTKSMFA